LLPVGMVWWVETSESVPLFGSIEVESRLRWVLLSRREVGIPVISVVGMSVGVYIP
jgi:hypothetical protein